MLPVYRLGILFLLLTGALRGESEWLDPDRTASAGTTYQTFLSKAIGGEASFLLYLPPGYEASADRRYPVLCWLHGLNGTQRRGEFLVGQLDAAIREGQAPPMIAVLVNNLRDSMYIDSKDGRRPIASVIVYDLIPHVDRTFRSISSRDARAIEGYSMGGHGAAVVGFGHPDVFGLVSVMAGALHDETSLAERRPEVFQKVSGGDPSYYRARSPWTVLERNAGRIRGRTRVRIGCGDQDGLIE
ncbi:MAG: alpha/beta hydrolase [Bryobacteraceae bacterium]